MVKKKGVQEKNQSKKHPRFWIFVLIGIIIFFGIAYAMWLFLQSPAIGIVRGKTLISKINSETKKEKEYKGEYLTFSYPAVYVEKTHEIPVNGPVKESIFLSANEFEGGKIAIVVEERIGGDFEASPSFKMRVDKPKEYDQEPVSVGGLSGFLFKKNIGMFERTFFFHSGDFVVGASTTSPVSAEGLEKQLFFILASIHFRQ